MASKHDAVCIGEGCRPQEFFEVAVQPDNSVRARMFQWGKKNRNNRVWNREVVESALAARSTWPMYGFIGHAFSEMRDITDTAIIWVEAEYDNDGMTLVGNWAETQKGEELKKLKRGGLRIGVSPHFYPEETVSRNGTRTPTAVEFESFDIVHVPANKNARLESKNRREKEMAENTQEVAQVEEVQENIQENTHAEQNEEDTVTQIARGMEERTERNLASRDRARGQRALEMLNKFAQGKEREELEKLIREEVGELVQQQSLKERSEQNFRDYVERQMPTFTDFEHAQRQMLQHVEFVVSMQHEADMGNVELAQEKEKTIATRKAYYTSSEHPGEWEALYPTSKWLRKEYGFQELEWAEMAEPNSRKAIFMRKFLDEIMQTQGYALKEEYETQRKGLTQPSFETTVGAGAGNFAGTPYATVAMMTMLAMRETIAPNVFNIGIDSGAQNADGNYNMEFRYQTEDSGGHTTQAAVALLPAPTATDIAGTEYTVNAGTVPLRNLVGITVTGILATGTPVEGRDYIVDYNHGIITLLVTTVTNVAVAADAIYLPNSANSLTTNFGARSVGAVSQTDTAGLIGYLIEYTAAAVAHARTHYNMDAVQFGARRVFQVLREQFDKEMIGLASRQAAKSGGWFSGTAPASADEMITALIGRAAMLRDRGREVSGVIGRAETFAKILNTDAFYRDGLQGSGLEGIGSLGSIANIPCYTAPLAPANTFVVVTPESAQAKFVRGSTLIIDGPMPVLNGGRIVPGSQQYSVGMFFGASHNAGEVRTAGIYNPL